MVVLIHQKIPSSGIIPDSANGLLIDYHTCFIKISDIPGIMQVHFFYTFKEALFVQIFLRSLLPFCNA